METIKIVRSSRRSSVGIQIMPDASVTVTIPYLYPKFLVNKILKEKEEWIREKQRMMLAHRVSHDRNEYWYLGKLYPLSLGKNMKELVEVSDKLYVGTTNIKYAKTYLESWYKQQARKIIVSRVQHYAKISGSTYRSISLSSATTRWGSCSSNKTLNFNWKLIMATIEVIDYVVCHELAHLTELNHSHAFWETVRKMYPLYREHRTWLRRHENQLTI
jgi:predicted metal-dependent hydrolase